MKSFLTLALILGVSAHAQVAAAAESPAGQVQHSRGFRRQSTLFIEPMDGYERYLIAALQKKLVPLHVVTDKAGADLILSGNSSLTMTGTKTWGGPPRGKVQVFITDAITGQVVWKDDVDRLVVNGNDSTAEEIAKHLRSDMAKR